MNGEEAGIFAELGALNVKNRCAGFNKSGKRCRTRLRPKQYLFCCDAHKPINKDMMEDGCFCCSEKLVNHKDALIFRCRHMVHKECYYEWLRVSESEATICMICRQPVLHTKSVYEDDQGNMVVGVAEVAGVEAETVGIDTDNPDSDPTSMIDDPMMKITNLIDEAQIKGSDIDKIFQLTFLGSH